MKLASRVIISKNDSILLGKRVTGSIEGGKWSIPGGKPDTNESLRLAAKREVLEETGIDLKDLVFLYLDVYGEWMSFYFFSFVDSETNFILDDEHSEMAWFSSQEIEDLKEFIAFNHYQIIKMFFEL